MSVHKSFIMSYGSKKKEKDIIIDVTPQEDIPKMIIEQVSVIKSKITTTHYDQGSPITLEYETYAIEQSVETTLDDYETYDDVEEMSQTKSRSYSVADIEDAVIIEEKEKDEDTYSEANMYFKEDIPLNNPKEVTYAQDLVEDTADASKKNKPETPTINEDVLKIHSEQEEEESKKFEDDLKDILKKKKVIDAEKVKLDPAEAAKNKNKGVSDKPIEEQIQDKMKNNHAIFDQIAQSMDMANTYDFGSIAMNKKFDDLEEETNEDFNKKITELIDKDEEKKEDTKPTYTNKKEDDKILTEDFLKDIDKLKELSSEKSTKEEQEAILKAYKETLEAPKNVSEAIIIDEEGKKTPKDYAKQTSFESTISIKKRQLDSRVFNVTDFVELTVDSQYEPHDCKSYTHINVTLVKDNIAIDDNISTAKFKIGDGPVTHKWTDLESGDYFLRFWFTEKIKHTCELTGTVIVKT